MSYTMICTSHEIEKLTTLVNAIDNIQKGEGKKIDKEQLTKLISRVATICRTAIVVDKIDNYNI